MRPNPESRNLIDRFTNSRELARAGIKAEQIGRHAVRLSRSGRVLGVWQGAAGSYNWFPTGQSHPQTSVFTIDDATRHAARTLAELR